MPARARNFTIFGVENPPTSPPKKIYVILIKKNIYTYFLF
jgi:hypothetical protein